MRNRNVIIGLVIAIVAVIVFLFVKFSSGPTAGNSSDPTDISNEQTLNESISIYYIDNATSYLKAEAAPLVGETEQEQLESTLERLSKEPVASETLSVAIPSTVSFRSVKLKNGIATVDVSSSYNSLKSGQEIICRGALVWTLTGLPFVDYVEITVEGSPLRDVSGKKVGAMNRDDILIDGSIPTEPDEMQILKLYFSNEDSTGLAVESREVIVTPGQIEKTIVEELIAGPEEEGHYATVPADTKVRSVTVSDGICYVDLSSEFITKHSGGSTGEMLTIYSIVNSLTELPSVTKVQFLIEGEKRQEFKGHVDFSQPFESMDINS